MIGIAVHLKHGKPVMLGAHGAHPIAVSGAHGAHPIAVSCCLL